MRFFFEELLIGFELKNFVIALAVLFIVYLAWESTYVRDYRVQPNAVLIIENNRRLLVDIGASSRRDLGSSVNRNLEPDIPEDRENQTPISSEEQSENRTTNSEIVSEESTVQIPEPPPSLEVVIEEVHDLANVRQQLNENVYRTLESFEEDIDEILDDNGDGPRQVIEAMDTTEGIRRRRLAFYDQENNGHQINEPTTEAVASSSSTQENISVSDLRVNNDNCSNENIENKNITSDTNEASAMNKNILSQPEDGNNEFRIKLKYLDDAIKLVKGTPNENIGDFKKKNFTIELSSQKFVRLVFNGHVLQPDSKTLQACGLFDNCVVHCLVHNRNPNANSQNQQSGQSYLGQENNTNQNISGNNNTTNNDAPTVGNFSTHESNGDHIVAIYAGVAFITLSLILCWYCRIQYHVLFSWYSTLVLILLTILFSILVPLLVFIENNDVQQTTSN